MASHSIGEGRNASILLHLQTIPKTISTEIETFKSTASTSKPIKQKINITIYYFATLPTSIITGSNYEQDLTLNEVGG